jgi:RNA polymerase sigma-70 factor (family 1)
MNQTACHYDEKELLRQLQQGDQQAFLELYDHYQAPLYHYILRFVKIPGLAEDLTQDVFLKVWEIRDRIEPTLSFRAYLYTISRNRVFKSLKKITADAAKRQQLLHHLQQAATTPYLQLQWQEYQRSLQKAIKALPPQRQRVFNLCREEGKSYEEVARELGISRNTVKEHMVLAVKCLKEYFHLATDISFLLVLFLPGLIS